MLQVWQAQVTVLAECRQNQKQFALPSTGRGNNQPRNSQCQTIKLMVVAKPTMWTLMKLRTEPTYQ